MQQYLTCRVPSISILQGITILKRQSLDLCTGMPLQDVSDASLFVSTFLLMRVSNTVQNAKRGDFARHRIKGKRGIELGAGMGLGGIALALLGCSMRVTDMPEVLPLLEANVANNLSSLRLRGEPWLLLRRSDTCA